MEAGPADKIFAGPLHPYTHGLLLSLPKVVKSRSEKLYAIPGEVPSPMNLPKGCAFQNRCAYATAICAGERPPLVQLDGNRQVACFHPLI